MKLACLGSLPCLFAASCSSIGRTPAPDLPFHVALIPLESREIGMPSDAQDSDPVHVSIDAAAMGTALASAMREACFVRVSTLRAPKSEHDPAIDDSGSRENVGTLDEQARLDWWVERAVEQDVDLLAIGTVAFSPAAVGEINDRFWLNLPLFLLGGPMCWFVGDRSYRMQARLDVRLYDVRLIEQQRAELGDRAAEVSSYQVEYSGTALSFVERAGTNVGSYALSVLVPAGLLARANDEITKELQRDAVTSLCEALREKIDSDRDRLLLPSGVNFTFRPGEIVARRTPDGFASVEGRIHFAPDSRVESLRGFSLSAGGPTATFSFGVPVADDALFPRRSAIYPLSGRVACAKDADCVRLTVAHGGGDDRMRTFTIPIGVSTTNAEVKP